MARGPRDVFLRHPTITTQLDSSETLNIVFDFGATVIGLLGDLAGGFLFHEALVADDRLVRDRRTEAVDRAAARDGLVSFALMLLNIIRYCTHVHIKQKRHIGEVVVSQGPLKSLVFQGLNEGVACRTDCPKFFKARDLTAPNSRRPIPVQWP